MRIINQNAPKDSELEERLARYDRWMEEGKIPFSSKVVPVRESLEIKQWVMPTERVLEFLRNARSFVLIDCECRTRYRRCDNPVETCFLINDAADDSLEKGEGRAISIEEAEEVLRRASESGLVHLTIYNPEQYVYAICSCCSCCCHELQFLKLYGRSDFVAHSEYIARTDVDACTHCGDCIDVCVFEARTWDGDRVIFDPGACYGCGLCVNVCPAEATTMLRRET